MYPVFAAPLFKEILGINNVLYFFSVLFFLSKKTFEPNVHAVRKSKDEWVSIDKMIPVSCLTMNVLSVAYFVPLACSDYKYHVQVEGRDLCGSKKGEKREGWEEEREQREEEREASDYPVSLHLWAGSRRHRTQNRCTTSSSASFSPACTLEVWCRCTCSPSLCSGWRGATDLHDSATSPVCKLVKKERNVSEEDEDEILSKLQRDDVSTSY